MKRKLKCVIYSVKKGVATIKLNRPEVLNAMNQQLWLDLEGALRRAEKNERIKAVIITGEGRAFSAGADLKESGKRTGDQYRKYLEKLQSISLYLINFPKPTIAAINGYAIGSGYELALACDLRIANKDAKIGSPEASVSSSVTGGAFKLLQEIVGIGRAKELLFTCEYIDGARAEKIGLVNQAVPEEELMSVARRMAEKISANYDFSLKKIKEGLRLANSGIDMSGLMNFEIEACLACVDRKERVSALENFDNRKNKGGVSDVN